MADDEAEAYNQLGESTGTGWLKAIVWISRFTGIISTISSIIIVITITYDRKRKLTKPNNRILLAMSYIDIPSSIVYALGTAMIPKDTKFYGAIGNDVTCTIQGFILYIGGASVPHYNASLCIYYLLTIRHRMSIPYFSKRIEPIMHGWSLLVPIGTASTCVALGMMNPYYDACHVRDAGCTEADCQSGTFYLMSAIYFIGILVSFAVVVYSLLSIYYGYVKLRKAMRRYDFTDHNHQSRKEIETSKQAILYIFSFMITHSWSFIHEIYYATTTHVSPFLAVMTSIFLPLQGFWNLLIFSRPIINRIKRIFPNASLYDALMLMMFHPNVLRHRGDSNPIGFTTSMSLPRLRNLTRCRLSPNLRTSDGVTQPAAHLEPDKENVIATG